MNCSEHSMQEVLVKSDPKSCSQEDNHGNANVSTIVAANDFVVASSAREILLGRNVENSQRGQEIISVGKPSAAEDLCTKSKGPFFKTSNVII
jgi:hypothetical protein